MSAGAQIILRSALGQVAEDARQEAQAAGQGTVEHEFDVGVVKAAEKHQYASELSARSEAWLVDESPAFRDGYLKTSTLIGTVAADPPFTWPCRHLTVDRSRQPHGSLLIGLR